MTNDKWLMFKVNHLTNILNQVSNNNGSLHFDCLDITLKIDLTLLMLRFLKK